MCPINISDYDNYCFSEKPFEPAKWDNFWNKPTWKFKKLLGEDYDYKGSCHYIINPQVTHIYCRNGTSISRTKEFQFQEYIDNMVEAVKNHFSNPISLVSNLATTPFTINSYSRCILGNPKSCALYTSLSVFNVVLENKDENMNKITAVYNNLLASASGILSSKTLVECFRRNWQNCGLFAAGWAANHAVNWISNEYLLAATSE